MSQDGWMVGLMMRKSTGKGKQKWKEISAFVGPNLSLCTIRLGKLRFDSFVQGKL